MDQDTTQVPRTGQPLQLVLIALAFIGILGTFFPWVRMPSLGSIAGTAGDGWFTFALFLVTFIMALVSVGKGQRGRTMLMWGGITALLAGSMGIWKILNFKSKMAEISSSAFGSRLADSVSIGSGLYIVVICGLLCAILAFSLRGKAMVAAPSPESLEPVAPPTLLE